MNRLKLLSAAAVFLIVCGFVANVHGEDAVQELTKIKAQWSEAEKNRDANGYLDKLFTDDFEVLNGRGHFNKQQMIDSLKDPEFAFTELHSDNIRVRLYGNVAVMTDRATSKGTEKGQPFSRQADFVRIFVKQKGRWRAVYAQASPAQK